MSRPRHKQPLDAMSRRDLRHGFRSHAWIACGTLCIVTLLAGCGGSDSSESAVVPPPSPSSASNDTSDEDPPGGMVMPEVEIPDSAQESSSSESGGLEMPKDATIPVDSGAAVSPKIKYGTWDQIHALAKSSGRVTVVDLWSLACEPCLKEFPGLVRLHKDRGDNIQCIAVDLDFDGRKSRPPEYYEDRVTQFLSSVGASGFPTFISKTPSDDIYSELKLASIPAVLIYGADGEVVKVFVDAGETAGFTYEEDVIPLVAQLAG